MESAKGTLIHLGDYEVVERGEIYIRVLLGHGVTITVATGSFPHATKVGDKLPLYTELTYAKPTA